MKIKEPEVMQEVRAVRDQRASRVEQEGIFAFYNSLNGQAAKLMALHRSPQRAAMPRSLKARKAKRRVLVDSLPEPKAILEVRRIRDEMPGEEKRLGRNYVVTPASVEVLHDRPVKKI